MAMFNKVSVESSAAYNTKDSEVTHGYRCVHVHIYIVYGMAEIRYRLNQNVKLDRIYVNKNLNVYIRKV